MWKPYLLLIQSSCYDLGMFYASWVISVKKRQNQVAMIIQAVIDAVRLHLSGNCSHLQGITVPGYMSKTYIYNNGICGNCM
jgi:hypothetical protein